MARKKTQAFPTAFLLLALAASATLLVILVRSPSDSGPADPVPDNAGNDGGGFEFEFYDRLQRNEVQVNAPTGEPAEPGTSEIEQLVEQLTPAAQVQLELATDALERIAESIVTGLELPAPDNIAAPAPMPAIPDAPASPAEAALAAPRASPNESATVLQSGAFRQQDLARSELERQRGLGLDVEIRQRPAQNGTMFLIQAGPFDSQDKLEETEMVFRLHNIATARRSTP